MVKAFSSGKNKAKQEDEQKSRKKQAKKEAKLMAQVDQAKKDARKAEQKAAKAQTNLQEQQAHLYKLEQELAQFRQADQVSSNESGQVELVEQEDTTSSPEAANTPIENIPAGQFDEGPGAQVYADISINPPPEEDLVISSGDGSIPVVTTDEHAWPPPQIREELAESIAEQVAQEHQTTATNEKGEGSRSPTEEEAEGHEDEHEEGSSRPRRPARRRTRSNTHQNTSQTDQE